MNRSKRQLRNPFSVEISPLQPLSGARFLWFDFLADVAPQFVQKLNFSSVVIHLIPVFYFNTICFERVLRCTWIAGSHL